MSTILDLPNEIHLLIATHLSKKNLYSCIRVRRSFYSAYIQSLWTDATIQHFKGSTIPEAIVRTNAHLIEVTGFSACLKQEYYTIVFPRLHTLRLLTFYNDVQKPHYLQVPAALKTQFAQHHPFVRKLVYYHKDNVAKRFWEVVGTEWTQLDELEFVGLVETDAVDAFWKVCERVKRLRLRDVKLVPEGAIVPIPSAHGFRELESLSITRYGWRDTLSPQSWTLQLLEQVLSLSSGLKSIQWVVSDVAFPVRAIQDALKERGCWPELCELNIHDLMWTDQDRSQLLRSLPSRRLLGFHCSGDIIEPLTYSCLKEMYFGHLHDLRIGRCKGVTSVIAQEILVNCGHLIHFEAPYIYVRDIATASKGWSCLKLENLMIYIAKQSEDEPGWDGQVFEQISRLRRLQILDLRREQYFTGTVDDDRTRPFSMATLNLQLDWFPHAENSSSYSGDGDGKREVNGSSDRGANVRCWSSLVQLKQFAFKDDRQVIGLKEALWIVEHWRDLWCITGEFRGVGIDHQYELERLFAAREITHYK
ncbi:hypothetical protein BGZ96_010535 [Linnemannia gamsii]|uniref:F-box domain-containing protein n=1 Tax=Linnemannia gamsii TaxID=64522 RepID=A0ABQ7JU02_9FUNG|nr:hypothetical protein BGZ96_010535 [Linnemannia gamsii]